MSYLVDLSLVGWAILQAAGIVLVVLHLKHVNGMLEAINNSLERVAVALKKR